MLAIGSACGAGDGYQQTGPTPEAAAAAAAASKDGSPTLVPPSPGYRDLPQLPPGIGYCLTPSTLYPNGYFTMNCHADGDCPQGSKCDGMLCRKPCTADSECPSPNVCGPPRGAVPVRFCLCGDCAVPVPAPAGP
jgi:hypothetical protein